MVDFLTNSVTEIFKFLETIERVIIGTIIVVFLFVAIPMIHLIFSFWFGG